MLKGVSMIYLKELWKYKVGEPKALEFSNNGYLGVADGCAYILDKDGTLVSKKCGIKSMLDVSFCCNRFRFIDRNGLIHSYDLLDGSWYELCIRDELSACYRTDEWAEHYYKITAMDDGFLIAEECTITFYQFDFNIKMKWHKYMCYISNTPVVHNGYIYVPRLRYFFDDRGLDALTILRLSDGSEVKTIEFDDEVRNVQVCGNYLALGTNTYIYLFDISDPINPKKLWGHEVYISGKIVAFSPDCRYLTGSHFFNHKFYLFDTRTRVKILEKRFESGPKAVAWWRNRIAVGLSDETIYMFKVNAAFVNKRKVAVRDILFKNKQINQFEID